jgi:hypothetical protein
MPRPGYLQPVTDPISGADFTRVTDPGGASPRRELPAVRHIAGTAIPAHKRGMRIRACWRSPTVATASADGRTYEPVFYCAMHDDCKWHPADPAVMICVHPNRIYSWEPQSKGQGPSVYVARAGIEHALRDFLYGSLDQPRGSGFRSLSIGSPSRLGETRWSSTAATNSPRPAPVELVPKSINRAVRPGTQIWAVSRRLHR